MHHDSLDPIELWQRLLVAINSKISRHNFEVWFSRVELRDATNDVLHFEVPQRHIGDWISDNYRELILSEAERLTGRRYAMRFTVTSEQVAQEAAPAAASPAPAPSAYAESDARATSSLQLNPNQTFENYVVGSYNQFAHAGARAVADKPSQAYNPLFLYGTVGLGKTHLLNAIGNQIIRNRPDARVVYLTGEHFLNELIQSIRQESMNEFRNKYRNSCDALLVDDIQFFAGKDRTQEEFFFTFNALHSAGKQIVITSDRLPKDIQPLEERLRSRFEWGLIADIKPPDFETRVVILQQKARASHILLPDDVANYIAQATQTNVRELEGFLSRLSASSSVYGRPIDLAFTQEVLGPFLETARPRLSVEQIQEAVARRLNLKVNDIKSHKRLKQLVYARQIAMFLCRRHTSSSFPDIGQKTGGRDHTTVIHAVNKIEHQLSSDTDLAQEIRQIERDLGM